MRDLTRQETEALRAQLERARERLDRLANELRAINSELEGLATERTQYRLLQDACAALEELGKLGASDLFWSGSPIGADGGAHLHRVRGRAESFQRQLDQIESARQTTLERIDREREQVELLEDDLFQALRSEEERKLEWIVEREITPPPGRQAIMAWTSGGEDDRRFRKSLRTSLLLALLLGLLLPQIDLPLPERWEPVEVPERLARLVQEQRPAPPPPVREPRKPEPRETQEEPPPAVDPAARAPEAEKSKPEVRAQGILAFREKFSDLTATALSDRLGANARIRSPGEAAIGRPERSMVATRASGSSGGINLSTLSRAVGGGGQTIEGVSIARATSSIGAVAGRDRPLSEGPGPARTDEEIQIVFDRHKAALYRLYNRELRRDPTLKGQMVLRIRIEPDGSVSLCELQATDMDAPQLAAQVVDRVRGFDFGAKADVPPITILYPIDFLPAS